ncbi:hypothetical protein [Microbacterium sp.]|uniref:hypothetical protein n=1 Tax=Microbacterium sp. TaxID=51671 RepID=UPI003C761F17
MSTSASVSPSQAFRVVGAIAIIAGGMLAAVTGPLQLEAGSWAAAYLVLVAGVAQYVMGIAVQHWHRTGPAQNWWWFALWNLGHIGVVGGTVAHSTILVFVASGTLVVALVLAFLATFRTSDVAHRMLLIGYRILLVLLAISIPVGMVISAIRNA